MSRIPELMDKSDSAMFLWWKQMATAGLAFHPDDGAEDIGVYVNGEWTRTFTDDEAKEVNDIVHGEDGMHATHGDLIYEAAMLASEPPAHTSARESAIMRDDWQREDIEITPFAAIEEVSGGYWVEARVFVHGE